MVLHAGCIVFATTLKTPSQPRHGGDAPDLPGHGRSARRGVRAGWRRARLHADRASIRAGVQGTERYRVRIEAATEGLQGDCSCPVGRDGGLASTGVAVSLAGWAPAGGRRGIVGAAAESTLSNALRFSRGCPCRSARRVRSAGRGGFHARLLAITATVGTPVGRFRARLTWKARPRWTTSRHSETSS